MQHPRTTNDERTDETTTPVARRRERGQAVVEFALVVPIIMFILLAVIDFGRVFTAQVAVESAAREAADFGAFNRVNWSGDRSSDTSNYKQTLDAMEQRWLVASSSLDDFRPPSSGDANPRYPATFDPELDILFDPVDDNNSDCHVEGRTTPCLVRVELEYSFDTIVPLGFDFFGTRLGLPDRLTFTRDSIFAVSDFELDEEGT